MYTVPGFPGSGATEIGTGTAGLTGPVPAVPAVLFLRQNVPSKFVKMDISDEELVKRLDHILQSELMTISSLKLNKQWRGGEQLQYAFHINFKQYIFSKQIIAISISTLSNMIPSCKMYEKYVFQWLCHF